MTCHGGRITVALAVVLASMLTACGSDGGDSSSRATSTSSAGDTTSSELQPADEALADAGRDNDGHPIVVGEIGGAAVKLGPALVAITSLTDPDVSEDRRTVTATVRVENRTDQEFEAPEVLMTCGGEDMAHFVGSTYETLHPVPPGSFYDGTRILEFPEGCDAPTIVAAFSVSTDDDSVAHWPIT